MTTTAMQVHFKPASQNCMTDARIARSHWEISREAMAYRATLDAMFAFQSEDRNRTSEHSTFETHAYRMPAAIVADYNEEGGLASLTEFLVALWIIVVANERVQWESVGRWSRVRGGLPTTSPCAGSPARACSIQCQAVKHLVEYTVVFVGTGDSVIISFCS